MRMGFIIIDWIVGLCLELRKDIGIRFISIDAYNHEKTINFYTKNLFEVLQALISSSVEGIFNFWINLSASSPVNVGVGSTLVALIKSPYW